jgi:hypothetical protein
VATYCCDVDRRSLLLAGLVSLAACDGPGSPTPPPVIDAVPDSSILEALFVSGTAFELTVGGRVTADVRDAGVLNLPTGRVIAADPSWLSDWQRLGITPYTAAVPPGRYPVSLSTMTASAGKDLVAAAKLTISAAAVTDWQPATPAGKDPAQLKPGQYFGVGVDVGCAGFLDAIALPHIAGEPSQNLMVPLDELSTERTDPVSGANYIAFDTGYGDGHYPVWTGRAADGKVSCFVMDMLITRLAA